MPSFRRILAATVVLWSVLLLSARSLAVQGAVPGPGQTSTLPQPGVGPEASPPSTWSGPARQLAAKIVSRTGARATLALTVRNASSLRADEAAEVRRALAAELRHQGVRLVALQQSSGKAPDRVLVTLSENARGYLWVAQIERPPEKNETPEVIMLETLRPQSGLPTRAPVSLVFVKALVWQQDEPILDLAAVGSAGAASLVLSPSKVSLVMPPSQAGAASEASARTEQSIPLLYSGPWPRDPRGRLAFESEGSFETYLPGAKCHGTLQPALTLDCQDADAGWPVATGIARATFAARRNFFAGQLTTSEGEASLGGEANLGEDRQVPPFFSVAGVPGTTGTVWVFDGVDGRVRVVGNGREIAAFEGWGSDVAAIRADCAHRWLVLADSAHERSEPDAVRAYEIGHAEPVAVGPAVEFSGPIAALWSEGDGGSALAVSRSLETGRYEAYRLTVSCGQ